MPNPITWRRLARGRADTHVYPQEAVLFHRDSTVVAGNALTIGHNAAQDFAHECYQNAGADADNFTQSFYLAAGSYTLNVLGTTGTGSGKIDWYIDGIKVVSLQDWYSDPAVQNVVATAAVTVGRSGQHVLTGVVNGKNAGSSGYAVYLTAIAFVPGAVTATLDTVNPATEYPTQAVMFHRYSRVTVGNALLILHDATQDFAHYSTPNVGGDGDTWVHPFYLAAGNYTLNVLGRTDAFSAIVDWYIDGVLAVAGQDWYSAGGTANVVQTGAVTVVGSGQHSLTGVINGKNVASGWFYAFLTAIALT